MVLLAPIGCLDRLDVLSLRMCRHGEDNVLTLETQNLDQINAYTLFHASLSLLSSHCDGREDRMWGNISEVIGVIKCRLFMQ